MEKKKQKKEKAPSLGGNPFDNTDTQHATIGCGLYQEKLPVAGKTIGEIRSEFSDRLEIADNAVATVAGVEQGNDYRVGANELILFIQQAGEKGMQLPQRVRVMDGSAEQTIGEGTCVGNVTTYVIRNKDGSISSLPNAEEKPEHSAIPKGCFVHELEDNPKIVMDDGKVVYGCQVWWEPIQNQQPA